MMLETVFWRGRPRRVLTVHVFLHFQLLRVRFSLKQSFFLQ